MAGVGYTGSVAVALWGLVGMVQWLPTPVAPPILMMSSGVIWGLAALWDATRHGRSIRADAATYPPPAALPGGFVAGPVTPRGTVTMNVAAALRPSDVAAAPVLPVLPVLPVPPVRASVAPSTGAREGSPASFAVLRPPLVPSRPVPDGPETLVLTMATVSQLPSLVAHRVRQQWNTVAVRSPADPVWTSAPGQYAVQPAR